jgi:glycosyltransferase involved in cell wall biosynthesis
MPKLLQVTTVPITLRAFLLPIPRHFRAKGWQVDAMANGITGCPECGGAFEAVHEVQWTRNPLDPRNLRKAVRQVRAIVQSGDYDLVHVHTPVAAFVTRLALRPMRLSGKPKVLYTAHGFHFHRGGHPLKNNLFLQLEKMAGKWTDRLIVINREDERAALRHHLVPSERLCYVPGVGIDTAQYDPDKVAPEQVESVRAELGLSPDDRLFLMVAEFNPGKRHADVLHAFHRLNRTGTHLVFAGEGKRLAEMARLAETLRLGGRVHFLGFRCDVPVLLRASVASLLPSEREGLPRSVMESLCLQVPVIGADIRGVRDLLEGDCGWLHPVGDVNQIAEAMAHVLDHPEEAVQMGLRGREKMAGYDLRHILRLYEAIYDELLSL